MKKNIVLDFLILHKNKIFWTIFQEIIWSQVSDQADSILDIIKNKNAKIIEDEAEEYSKADGKFKPENSEFGNLMKEWDDVNGEEVFKQADENLEQIAGQDDSLLEQARKNQKTILSQDIRRGLKI